MNLFALFRDRVAAEIAVLAASGVLPTGLDTSRSALNCRDPAHGDLACNAAMVLAGPAKRRPRELAVMLAQRLLTIDGVATVEVAGPGFINLRLTDTFWHMRLVDVLLGGRRLRGTPLSVRAGL